jgi:TonB family protein
MEFSSGVLSALLNVSLRALVLAAVAGLGILALRIRSAAAKHAVWAFVAAGMLISAVLWSALPVLPLRVLRAEPPAPVLSPALVATAVQPGAGHVGTAGTAAKTARSVSYRDFLVAAYALVACIFLIRLAFGYSFTRRLLRAAKKIGEPWAAETYASTWISVPLTVGWRRPKILLPADWETWSRERLEAVLAHENTHVRRADWAIAVLAGVNRCILWFHPVAWWLERRLALLAEQACDDSALLLVSTESYAQALLDMAAAVKNGQGRLVWEAMAMAKASEVRKRIELILDETREIPKGLTRLRWAALAACSVPLIYLASVVTPAPVLAHPQAASAAAQADTVQMEQRLAANPHDLGLRKQLVLAYFANNVREPRLTHIFWMIANHPEAPETGVVALGITPRPTAMNTAEDYARAAGLWKQQTAMHTDDPRVLGNAAQFFAQPGGDFAEAERLFIAARAADPQNGLWARDLAQLYAASILGATGDPRFDNWSASFAPRIKTDLENSTDRVLVIQTALGVATAALRPRPGTTLPAGTLDLNEHPLLIPAVDWAQTLLKGTAPTTSPQPTPHIAQAPTVQAPTVQAPPPIRTVRPAYPPLAKQARISGTVHLSLTIAPDGTPQKIEVIGGHPLLVPAAIEAVRQWRWNPSDAGAYGLDVNFSLSDAGVASAGPRGELGGIIGSPGSVPMVVMGGQVYESKLISKVDPVYPPAAREAGITGVVRLSIEVAEDGHVDKVESIAGHPLLVGAAIEAVKQWRYEPTRLGTDGPPVKVRSVVEVPFVLGR